VKSSFCGCFLATKCTSPSPLPYKDIANAIIVCLVYGDRSRLGVLLFRSGKAFFVIGFSDKKYLSPLLGFMLVLTLDWQMSVGCSVLVFH
jgi:hypothetical protein